MGVLDAGNILHGILCRKRNRTKVDYRKLADAMFGDESDEDAKGAKKEYTYRPRAKLARARKKDDEDGWSDDDETPKKKKARKVAPKNDKLEARVHEKNIREDGSDGDDDSDDDDETPEKKRARKVAVK